MGGRRIAALRRSPFKVLVGASRGIHTLKARVTFTDATPAVTLRMRFRACGSAAVRVRSGAPTQPSAPPAFTG